MSDKESAHAVEDVMYQEDELLNVELSVSDGLRQD